MDKNLEELEKTIGKMEIEIRQIAAEVSEGEWVANIHPNPQDSTVRALVYCLKALKIILADKKGEYTHDIKPIDWVTPWMPKEKGDD